MMEIAFRIPDRSNRRRGAGHQARLTQSGGVAGCANGTGARLSRTHRETHNRRHLDRDTLAALLPTVNAALCQSGGMAIPPPLAPLAPCCDSSAKARSPASVNASKPVFPVFAHRTIL